MPGPAPLPHPLCMHLRSKRLYMLDADRDLNLQDLTGGGYDTYWCLHTHTDTGPDSGWVLYERCAPGRACYEMVERSVGVGRQIQEEHVPGGDWPDPYAVPEPEEAAEAEPPAERTFVELLRKRTGQA